MRHEITIVCDDIRRETGNKISLMGLYDDAIVHKEFPASLAKLCIFQRWIDTSLKKTDIIRLELIGGPLQEPISAECRLDPEHYSPAATKLQVTVALAPFFILKPGEIELVTYFAGSDEVAHRHKLEIRADPNLKV
jgi:hypothetical protein